MQRIEQPISYDSTRQYLLETFPKPSIPDFYPNRVEAFIQSFGLRVAPWIVYDKRDFKKVASGILAVGLSFEDHAQYQREIDLAVVERNKRLEKYNGLLLLEADLTEELGHGTVRQSVQLEEPFSTLDLLNGDSIDRSPFFEEGFATLLRGMFVQQNMRPPLKNTIGLWKEQICKVDPNEPLWTININGEEMVLPDKFAVFEPTAGRGYFKLSYTVHSLAGIGIELLCFLQPSLWQALIDSRSLPNAENIGKIKDLINDIKLNLFDKLLCINDTQSAFTAAMKEIVAIMGGMNEVKQFYKNQQTAKL